METVESPVEPEGLSQALLEASTDCIKLLDVQGHLLHVNGPGLCLLGLPEFAAVAGELWWVLWPEAERPRVRAAFELARAGERQAFEVFCPNARGTPMWWEVSLTPLWGPGGEVQRLLVMSRDITERHSLLESLSHSQTRLEQAYGVQQRFVSDAAHELRAPLTAIQGNLELLAHYPQMTEQDRREALEEASQEAARLGRVVSDLLTLARGESGEALERSPVWLDRVVQEVLRSVRSRCAAHTVQVPALPACRVLGNRDRLHQLVLILIDNALKYTPAGGELSVWLEQSDTEVCLHVRDSGLGIPPEEQGRIFERFYRASSAGGQGGSGLGLSIAQWIAGAHGGQILLESAPGVGSTFQVRLPRPDAGSAESVG